MKQFSLILILLISCNPFTVNPSEIYYIQEGNHYPDKYNKRIAPVFDKSIEFVFTFNITHIYAGELNTDDINKLYGLSSSNIHNNSARFGWRNINNDTIEILAYWYKNGNRGFKLLGTTTPKKQNIYYISIKKNKYIWKFNNKVFEVLKTKNTLAFRTFPYFGGDKPAPHYMFFKIEELN